MLQENTGRGDSLQQSQPEPLLHQKKLRAIVVPANVEYTSKQIDVGDKFLTGPPKKPITSHHIDFISSALPQYKDCVAIVLQNVLSLDECNEMVRLAEASTPDDGRSNSDPWKPALVNMQPGLEMSMLDYRKSSRIIWDQQIVVDRLWERCARSAGLRELLATCPGSRYDGSGQWEFSRLNDRMRFLKYIEGEYFRPHIDGPYYYEDNEEKFQTFYTVHLYLNDSCKADPRSGLVGGATSFLSRDRSKRVDVNPKAGSVLIFQHQKLFHEGAEVINGVKFTMRTDILYRWVPAPKNG